MVQEMTPGTKQTIEKMAVRLLKERIMDEVIIQSTGLTAEELSELKAKVYSRKRLKK